MQQKRKRTLKRCEVCNKQCKSLANHLIGVEHIIKITGKYNCPHCKESFTKATSWRSHKSRKHNSSSTDNKKEWEEQKNIIDI